MPRVRKKVKSSRKNIKIANRARLFQSKTVSTSEIINLNTFLEEEPESDLDNEIFSFGASDLNDENIALELFNKLFINENQLIQKKRVYYTGLSSRTNRRKNQKLREAAVGTAQISKFFILCNQQETNSSLLIQNEQSNKNNEEILNTSIQNDNNEDKIENAIKFIENILLENISNTVARIHKGDQYHARCIRKWAKICLEGKHIPINKGKFSSRSLLNDELISFPRVTMILGANCDGYWNGEKLVAQLPDVLVASKMNKGPGGIQPIMRDIF
ncbi:4872_t:CDS:2 [Diversispora eburnea]|uniref:4872_t:CDS:1 n=1 Tax=Diversispora eburnea TaxID=1213867 RepID=A0A9N9BMJ8_9GLOM|nr:4872_t:CDS:2 [Diversispora eburnea]